MLQKRKRGCKREFNDIFGWLGVLVYSLKRSKAQKIRCGKESWIMEQPKHAEEKSLRRVSPFISNLF